MSPAAHVVSPATVSLGVAGWWGIVGTVALLVDAVVRLTPIALEPLRSGGEGLGPGVALAYVGAAAFMAYFEGYRGFQLRFSPRAVVRALALGQPGVPLWVRLAAPLCCMGLVHATRRRLVASWLLVAGIVLMVVMIRWLPQPWRGAVDGGVVVGLSWGAITLLVELARALMGTPAEVDPDLP